MLSLLITLLPILLIGVVLGESPAGLLGFTAGQGRPLYLQLTTSGIKAQRGECLIDRSSAMVQTGLELMAWELKGLVLRSFSDSHIDRGLQTVIEQYFEGSKKKKMGLKWNCGKRASWSRI